MWRNARASVERLELPLATEGRRDLWVHRDQEVRRQLARVDEERKRRWLVVVPSGPAA